MMIQNEFIKRIKDFGLNSYEAKIWTALLSRGISSAGELSEISNVPRSRTYDVLESLEKKGFIMMKLGKPIKYMAIPPADVVEILKKRVREDSVAQEKQMDDLKKSDVLQELTLLHTKGIDTVEPTDFVGLVKNRESLYDYADSILKTAEKTVVIMTSEDGLIRKHEYLKKTLKKLSDNNIKIKIITPILSKKSDSVVKELKGVAEIKQVKEVSARFIIVDNNKAIFMMNDDAEVHPSYDSGIWVNTQFFANNLKEMFEMLWKNN